MERPMLLIALFVLLRSLSAHAGEPIAQSNSGPSYDQLFPYYAEYCATTQITPIGERKGGAGGHAILYIKGACRDRDAAYPRLKICDESVRDMSDPESGAAISTDQMFSNVNWIALDGRNMLFHGGLPAQATVDEAARQRLESQVLELGIFRGVEVHSKYQNKWDTGKSDEVNLIRAALGTDFALSWGRNLYCTRMPLSRDKIPPLVGQLNQLNEELHESSDGYNWNLLADNCTHTTHNALAAAGVWPERERNEFLARQLFNLAVPSNDFIDLTELGNDTDLTDVAAIYRNEAFRRTVLQERSLSVRPGVITEIIPIRKANKLFETGSGFLILDLPFPNLKKRGFNRILRNLRYGELKANLSAMQRRYDYAIRALESGSRTYDQVVREHPDLGFEPGFARFFVDYTETLKQLARETRELQLRAGN